jgi:predicted exporter
LPRSEPEIIPPARGNTQAYRSGPEWFSAEARGTNRVFVARMGSWSILGIVLLVGLVAGATLAILLGTLLIALPIIGLLIAAAMISGGLRSHLRPPR